jgi:ribosomal protein S4
MISWKEESTESEPYKKSAQDIESKVIPSWLSLDKHTFSGRVLTLPTPSEIDAKFDAKMIVTYYSR